MVAAVSHIAIRSCRRAELPREVRREGRQVHFARAHVKLHFDRAVHLLHYVHVIGRKHEEMNLIRFTGTVFNGFHRVQFRSR